MKLLVSTKKNLLDIDYIYNFLIKTYWANKRTFDQVKKSIDNSLCFGLYLDQKQIGFARIVTDKVVFSYLMDVFIDEKHQGKEYGKYLLKEIYLHPDLVDVKNHYLHTKDAQDFYRYFNFEIYSTPEKFMVKS